MGKTGHQKIPATAIEKGQNVIELSLWTYNKPQL
jgi:hypothetical protein